MPDLPVMSSNENGVSCRRKNDSRSEMPGARIIAAAFGPVYRRRDPFVRSLETRAVRRPPFRSVPDAGTPGIADRARGHTLQRRDESSIRPLRLPKNAADAEAPDH